MKQNITMITDLPDVDELEYQNRPPLYSGAQMLPKDHQEKVAKFIRNTHSAPDESGMISPPYDPTLSGPYSPIGVSGNIMPQRPMAQRPIPQPPVRYPEDPAYLKKQPPQVPYQVPVPMESFRQSREPGELSCIEVADHIKHCPLCSKFYANDKTLYMIVIIVLSIICILLIKKVLDI